MRVLLCRRDVSSASRAEIPLDNGDTAHLSPISLRGDGRMQKPSPAVALMPEREEMRGEGMADFSEAVTQQKAFQLD